MKKYVWLLAALLLIVLVGCTSMTDVSPNTETEAAQPATQPQASEMQATQSAQEKTEEPSTLAPDFTVVDGDGNEVRLSDFFGKPIVLNFWASWCGPCRSEMPDFNETFLEIGEEVRFLMVNMTDGAQETLEIAKQFVADSGYDFPVFYDVNYDAAITYGVSSLPTTYFIAADGTLTAYAMGAIDEETLMRGIDMIYTQD